MDVAIAACLDCEALTQWKCRAKDADLSHIRGVPKAGKALAWCSDFLAGAMLDLVREGFWKK